MIPKKWVCTALIALFSPCVGAQTDVLTKTWTFQLPHGSLQVGMKVESGGLISLGISPHGRVPEAPIDEQVEPLEQVLAEIRNLGFDPTKVSYIDTRIWDQTVLRKLAYACADSKEWRSTVHAGGKDKGKMVIRLLNESGAYEPYNVAFKAYGIQMRVTEAEMIGLMPFSKIPPRNASDRAAGDLLVPADAALGMRPLSTSSPNKE